jgi:selT/selW/selH-like putative selenoprotein
VDAIRKAHGSAVQTEAKTGSGGIFDVAIDGNVVFSKFDEHRFPNNQEILAEIASRLQKV